MCERWHAAARASKSKQRGFLCVITGAQVKYARRCRDFAETYDFMAKVEWILWGPNIFMKRNPMRDDSFLLFSRATRAHKRHNLLHTRLPGEEPSSSSQSLEHQQPLPLRSSSHYLQRHYSPHTGLEPVLYLVGRWKP